MSAANFVFFIETSFSSKARRLSVVTQMSDAELRAGEGTRFVT
jgi:hypothetical protein